MPNYPLAFQEWMSRGLAIIADRHVILDDLDIKENFAICPMQIRHSKFDEQDIIDCIFQWQYAEPNNLLGIKRNPPTGSDVSETAEYIMAFSESHEDGSEYVVVAYRDMMKSADDEYHALATALCVGMRDTNGVMLEFSTIIPVEDDVWTINHDRPSAFLLMAKFKELKQLSVVQMNEMYAVGIGLIDWLQDAYITGDFITAFADIPVD